MIAKEKGWMNIVIEMDSTTAKSLIELAATLWELSLRSAGNGELTN